MALQYRLLLHNIMHDLTEKKNDWSMQNTHQTMNLQKTPHILPAQAS